jgi:hypothetical protein
MKKIFLIKLCLLFTLNIYTQNDGRKEALQDKIKAMKIGFITDKLELTSEESQKFWPIYNQMETERESLLQDKKNGLDKLLLDKDAQTYITRHFEIKEKELVLEKKYSDKLKSAIPTKKVAMLYFVEKQFRQEIMNNIISKVKEKRKEKGGRLRESRQ